MMRDVNTKYIELFDHMIAAVLRCSTDDHLRYGTIGVDTVLRNATIITQKKIGELDRTVKEIRELMELAIKRGEEREKELQMELLRQKDRENFFFLIIFLMFLYIIFLK